MTETEKSNAVGGVLIGIVISGLIAGGVGLWSIHSEGEKSQQAIAQAATPAARIKAMAASPYASTDATQVVAAIDRLTGAVQELTREVEQLKNEVRR